MMAAFHLHSQRWRHVGLWSKRVNLQIKLMWNACRNDKVCVLVFCVNLPWGPPVWNIAALKVETENITTRGQSGHTMKLLKLMKRGRMWRSQCFVIRTSEEGQIPPIS